MNRFHTVFVLASIFGGWVATPAFAQTHPGLAPYTPSRIQWLAVQAQATFRHDSTSDEPYTLGIVMTDPETLTITVRYNPILDQISGNPDRDMLRQGTRNGMTMAVTVTTAALKGIANAAGWNWLKVKEDVKNYTQAQSTH